MPKYVMLIVAAESGNPQDFEADVEFEEVMQMHRDFTALVESSGATMLGGEALQPSSTATFLRGTRTPNVHVVDNPEPALKEILGGFYVIQAEDDDHALRLAQQCPAQLGYIELRPVWDIP